MQENKFQYTSDWINSWSDYLQNIEEPEKESKKSIKCSIIESNQTLENLIKNWNITFHANGLKLKLYPSKELLFNTLELSTNEGKFLFYVKFYINQDSRFWIIYTIEEQQKIKKYISRIFQDYFGQDKIYLTNEMMNQYKYSGLDYLGNITINEEKNFLNFIEFSNYILEDYGKKMNIIEGFRFNAEKNMGKLIEISLTNAKILRNKFIERLNGEYKTFKMYFTKIYEEENYDYYRVADLHNGDHFYAQIFDDKIYLNLHKRCCGNNVFRLYTNLQKFYFPKLNLMINNQKIL